MLTALLAAAAMTLPITVHEDPCPGLDPKFYDGCYLADTDEVYVLDRSDPWAFWHEVGHAFDEHRLDDGERRAFSCLPAVRYEYDPGRCGNWDGAVAEVFADAYGNCAMGAANPRSDYFMNGHDYTPTRRQHLNACRFINRAAD